MHARRNNNPHRPIKRPDPRSQGNTKGAAERHRRHVPDDSEHEGGARHHLLPLLARHGPRPGDDKPREPRWQPREPRNGRRRDPSVARLAAARRKYGRRGHPAKERASPSPFQVFRLPTLRQLRRPARFDAAIVIPAMCSTPPEKAAVSPCECMKHVLATCSPYLAVGDIEPHVVLSIKGAAPLFES